MARKKSRAKYKRIRVKSPKLFDKRSFRIKDIGRKGFTKLVVACKKGDYDSKRKRCKTSMKTQAILLNKKDFGI